MKIGLFSIPNKYNTLLKHLGNTLNIEFTFYRHAPKKFRFSFDIFTFFHKVAFHEAIIYSIKLFEAKRPVKLPRYLLQIYFALELFEKYLRYILTLDPQKDYYIFWNGKKPRHLIAIQIIKLWGIKVCYMENGLLPNRLVFDAKGVNFENSVPRNRGFFESYKNRASLPLTLTQRAIYNHRKFQKERTPLPKNFIFIPFQVDYDSQIILYSPWIKNMRVFFDIIQGLAAKSSYTFIIKEHPSSKKDYHDLHQKSKKIDNLFFMNGYTTQELIEKSSAVLTINSTVGIESLLFTKRVIVVGDAFYAIEGITKHAKSVQEILNILEYLEDWTIDKDLVECFLSYLYTEYLIPIDHCPSQHFKSILEGNSKISYFSYDQ